MEFKAKLQKSNFTMQKIRTSFERPWNMLKEQTKNFLKFIHTYAFDH